MQICYVSKILSKMLNYILQEIDDYISSIHKIVDFKVRKHI